MRHATAAPFVLALALPLFGCAKGPKDRLQGRWVGERVDSFHPSQAGRATGWVANTSFEFKGSRVTVSIPAESPREGTYKVTSAQEDQLRIAFLRPDGPQDEVDFLFEGEDALRWMLGDGRSVVLRRQGDL